MNDPIKIEKIEQKKDRYIDFLLLADPSEEMIKKYLYSGELYLIRNENEIICASVVTLENGIAEIKNICTSPNYQKMGYGKAMINFLINKYAGNTDLIIGTGSTGSKKTEFYQINFYRKCGFKEYRTIKNFFVDNYPEPIIEENGEQCIDMVFLKYKGKKKN